MLHEQRDAAGFEHAVQLGERRVRVLEHAQGERVHDAVEGRIREREVLDVGHDESNGRRLRRLLLGASLRRHRGGDGGFDRLGRGLHPRARLQRRHRHRRGGCLGVGHPPRFELGVGLDPEPELVGSCPGLVEHPAADVHGGEGPDRAARAEVVPGKVQARPDAQFEHVARGAGREIAAGLLQAEGLCRERPAVQVVVRRGVPVVGLGDVLGVRARGEGRGGARGGGADEQPAAIEGRGFARARVPSRILVTGHDGIRSRDGARDGRATGHAAFERGARRQPRRREGRHRRLRHRFLATRLSVTSTL